MIDILTLTIWISYVISLYIILFWLIVYIEDGFNDDNKDIKSYPVVSVVIPAYNEEETIAKTVDSVLNLDYPKDKLEIIVINDGSKDKTAEIVKTYSNVTLINQENSGKGVALNKGLDIAKGEFFVCLDADSMVKEDALKKMLPHFENSDIAAVLPLMKIIKPKTWIQKVQWCEYLINFFYKKLMGILDCIHVAPGPFSVYRKSIIKELGGFDKNNLTEDLEISLRLQKYHYKILQVLNAEVFTTAPDNFKDFYKQRNRWYKGTLLNIWNYRFMIFNPEYGDFGMLQLPRVAFAGVIAISLMAVIFYNHILKPLLIKLYDLSFIKFNIAYSVDRIIERFDILNLNYTNLFFAVVMMILGLYVLRLSYNYTREKIFKEGYFAVPAYLILYSMLASWVWLGVIFDLIRGKTQKW